MLLQVGEWGVLKGKKNKKTVKWSLENQQGAVVSSRPPAAAVAPRFTGRTPLPPSSRLRKRFSEAEVEELGKEKDRKIQRAI